MLVVVLEESEHMLADVGCLLQCRGDVVDIATVLADGTQRVVESYLVVEVVEASLIDEAAVEVGLVYLANEYDAGILCLNLGHCPLPEFHGCELHHIATEAVDLLRCPVEQNLQHLYPGVGYGCELMYAGAVVDAVVELYGVEPVVAVGYAETVVAGCSQGVLGVGLVGASQGVDVVTEGLLDQVIEVVVSFEENIFLVVGAKVECALGTVVAFVVTGNVVGDEVHYHLHTCIVGAAHE